MNQYIVIAAWAVIFILLLAGFLFLMQAVTQIDRAQINLNHIMADLHSAKEARVKHAEAERRVYGTTAKDEKKPGLAQRFLIMLNNQLAWSGVSIEHPWIDASLYIVVMIVLSVVAFAFGLLAFNAVVGFLLTCVVVIVPYAYILHLVNRNYHLTETSLQFFINLVSSNSAAASDLNTVLEMSAPYMTDPIRSAIYRAVATSKVTNNPDDTVWQLEREIEHPIFCNFIRNLDICAKHDADFRTVAKDFSVQAEKSISALEKLRAIFANARNEVILMVVVGVLLSFMTADFCGESLFDVLQDMTTSALGMLCIFLECVIYIATFCYIILGRKR